ncbi:hypothetical protein BDZ94DRAFT_1265773 [Collybia nuda]|uniref:ubiquitinyl hydrolase 1 n=1 Tax=Collybia nuda TaxID=64659 RepID=A0A9P5Y0P4_9AGAR|nr:hypothetical protein BDZ94DRAFT_1265773 [Collybia nuda]
MVNTPLHADPPTTASKDTQPSRKRQRTQSMQSDASSSSLKRSVAEGSPHDGTIRSLRTDQMSTLTLADSNHDIDSYMAEQGEGDIPVHISLTPVQDRPNATFTSVTPAEKVTIVEKGKGRQMEAGEMWYLISRDWYKRWRKACTGEVDKEGPMSEDDLGPVDNSQLLDSYGNLQLSLAEGVDVEYVPEEVWTSFVSWYGEAIHPLPRRVIARGASKITSIELRPPRLKVLRLVKGAETSQPFPYITVSSGDTIKTLCTKLAEAVSPNTKMKSSYRIWKIDILRDEWASLEFPAASLLESGGKLLEESDKTLEEEGVELDDAFVVEFEQANGWIADDPKIPPKPPITIAGRPGVPAPIFKPGGGFFNQMGVNASSSSTTSVTGSSSDWKTTTSRKEKVIEPGTLGLGNMGNTCFMNSALQCLAHNKELTDYFLTGLYQEELNPDNPLGMHGAIAEAFGTLLQRIWVPTGPSTSYSPREFKSQLQRFAPQFSGYQQHDSQELVAFLLDGLHEDLNRVLKKPYVEKPDWEGGGDVELVQLAQNSWEGYMKRNDSVIVDLFQGQYKSTLICPECEKVSITFDPFMYLTLPLPIQIKWKHTIYYVPWDLHKPHVKVPVEINRDASFKDLRVLLGRWMDAPPDNLLTLEIFSNKFYKNLGDNVLCGDMSDNDTIVCFELPCHAQQSRTYKKQPEDPIIVPIYLCDLNLPARHSFTKAQSLFGYPMVIAIEQDQAKDVHTIYDVVISRLGRWTNNARDLYNWEAGAATEIDEVSIKLNGFPPIDALTEIKENGDVVTVHEVGHVEGDIADAKNLVTMDDDDMDISSIDSEPRVIGTKKDLFGLRLQVNHKEYGTQNAHFTASNRWELWDRRIDEADNNPVLLREGDAFYCEFDENVKAYYFGDDSSRWEHARWDIWEEFLHPEYAESKAAASERKKGISLQDCLEEFTKEERLGEDDLWYCPRCKKHQQATKKFDIWKVPDVLVVHLKRFSNSRTLRDKIDTFIDFPVEGLDLTDMVGEREVAKRLVEQGLATEELQLGDLDEPLVYDLFGVDEHMGGLGGGHYRAYALNHLSEKWYHFDDSYVTPARPTDAVNANAYLLFYRRRSTTPLGGKTHHKIEEARLKSTTNKDHVTIDTQLPTPPNEDESGFSGSGLAKLAVINQSPGLQLDDPWVPRYTSGSSAPTPPHNDPPGFDESQTDELVVDHQDPLSLSSHHYDFPDPSGKTSPSSSNEAEVDSDDAGWGAGRSFSIGVDDASQSNSPDWQSGMASPTSSFSDNNPFSDANVQKSEVDDAGSKTHHEEFV